MSHASIVRHMLPNEVCTVLGIPVFRVGLLWFEIDADYATGLLTVDQAERALEEMSAVPTCDGATDTGRSAVVSEVAAAILAGRTLTASRFASSYTVGPVLGEVGGWACVDNEGEAFAPAEAWPFMNNHGFSATRYVRDESAFGAAFAFVQAVGPVKARAALPGAVVPWCCQDAARPAIPAADTPHQEPAAVADTGAQVQASDAPACQDGPALPIRVSWTVATAQHGDAVHVVVGERVAAGRWVREPGQALCKPRGLRLKSAAGAPSCKGCLGEAERRNITLT